MNKTVFFSLLLISLCKFANAKTYLDSNGYLCVSPAAKNVSTVCININDFNLDTDYSGNQVLLVWEKFDFDNPLVINNFLFDQTVYEMAIKCSPSEQDAVVQENLYYKGNNQTSWSYDKYSWSFQNEPPGTLQDVLNNFVCNGNLLKAYAKANNIDLSNS